MNEKNSIKKSKIICSIIGILIFVFYVVYKKCASIFSYNVGIVSYKIVMLAETLIIVALTCITLKEKVKEDKGNMKYIGFIIGLIIIVLSLGVLCLLG